MIIGIDFDGTCVTHEFPAIGKDIGAVPVLKELLANKHQLILWTIRSNGQKKGEVLTDAVNWFQTNDIHLYGINENPTQKYWSSSNKASCHLYIDDAALGCPLLTNPEIAERPYVDWNTVRQMLIAKGVIKINV